MSESSNLRIRSSVIFFLLALFFYNQSRNCMVRKSFYRVRSVVDIVDQAGYIPLMFQACMQGLVKGIEYLVRLVYGFQ